MEEAQQKDIKYPRIAPRCISGPCSAKNKGALDWSPTGLLAYGCNFTVVVVDTTQLQVIQTLDKHKHPVVKVKWPARTSTGAGLPSLLSEKSTPYPLFLASGDACGQIIIWDVISGSALHFLSDGNKPIQDLAWAQHFDQSEKYLTAIHPPSSFVVWDVSTGAKLWKKTYSEQLLAMDFDPFDPSRLAFVCPDCILLVEDFSLFKASGSSGRKFYISSPKTAGTPASTPSGSLDERRLSTTDRSRDRLRKLMRDIIVGESAPRPDEHSVTSMSECLQLSFHRSLRHIICLVYAREVLLVDLRIQHTVAVLPSTDRMASPLQQLLLCRQRDVLICLHESGSLSCRVRRGIVQPPVASGTVAPSPWIVPEIEVELQYDQRCQTDSIRLTKNNKILSAALHPLLENRAALLLTDGRLYLYDINTSQVEYECLSEMMPPLWTNGGTKFPLKFTLSGLLGTLSGYSSAQAVVMKMCPPLTVKNCHIYQPLVAIGCSNGTIQICDVADGLVKKELAVHNYPVKGIEWTQMDEFLSFGQSASNGAGGWLRNELLLTNVQTGRSTVVRADRGEEPPIELIRVSPLKQYFMVVFKDAPPELWDLRHLTLIRTLPRRFPSITTLEWLPSHLQRHVKRSLSAEDSDSSLTMLSGLSVKEFFVFADPDGNLYHLTVEGSVVKDGARLSPPNTLNGIVTMTWKSEWMALGDAEGGVAVWEWKSRHFRPLPNCRSPIRKLRFAPGKNNMKLLILHMEGIDIWDVKDSERLGQWKNSPFRDYLSVIDADWCASDRPLLACSDGTVRVFDLTLQQCNSAIYEYDQEDILCPLTMPRSAYQSIKTGLQLNLAAKDCSNAFNKGHIVSHLSSDRPLFGAGNLPEQCLLAALRCGDTLQAELWTVASYYLQRHAGQIVDADAKIPVAALDTVHDLLCDSASYKLMAAERAAMYQSKPRAYEQTRQLTRDHLLLNDKDKAIALLLNMAEPDHGQFYSNHLLACLAAIMDPTGCQGNAHSTLKLVATHLIASGHVWQGVEILILDGQILDACRYLQSNGLWEDSARVAKLLLPDAALRTQQQSEGPVVNDAAEIWTRWAGHLSSGRQKFAAALVLIAVGAWHKAAELLVQQQMPDAAALLLRSAERMGLYQAKETAQQEFMHGVYGQYARLLHECGWPSAAKEWAEISGASGQKLLDEWKILTVDAE